jgi:insulysin
MQLCLLGNESLDDLEKYAVDMFSEIPNKSLPKIDFPSDPYTRNGGNILYVVPVQDLRQLSMSWVIPDSRDEYQSNPSNYISHLVGHEGEGSLLSELKKKGWCNNLYAGARREARGFQFFNLTVDLSEEGGENIEEIMKLVYQYLNMLKQQSPHKWIFDEMNDLGRIKFAFKDKEKPIGYVSSITANMQVYNLEDVLSAGYYLTKV